MDDRIKPSDVREVAEKYHDVDGLYPAIVSRSVSSRLDCNTIYRKYADACRMKSDNEWSKELLGHLFGFDDTAYRIPPDKAGLVDNESDSLSYYDDVKGLRDVVFTLDDARILIENNYISDSKIAGFAVVISHEKNIPMLDACRISSRINNELYGEWASCLEFMDEFDDASWIITNNNGKTGNIVLDNEITIEPTQLYMNPIVLERILSAPSYNADNITDSDWMEYAGCVIDMCLLACDNPNTPSSSKDVDRYIHANRYIEINPILLKMQALMIILHPEMYRFNDIKGSAYFAYQLFRVMNAVISKTTKDYRKNVFIDAESFIEILRNMKNRMPVTILVEDVLAEFNGENYAGLNMKLNSMLSNKSFLAGRWPYFYEKNSKYIVPGESRARTMRQ